MSKTAVAGASRRAFSGAPGTLPSGRWLSSEGLRPRWRASPESSRSSSAFDFIDFVAKRGHFGAAARQDLADVERGAPVQAETQNPERNRSEHRHSDFGHEYQRGSRVMPPWSWIRSAAIRQPTAAPAKNVEWPGNDHAVAAAGFGNSSARSVNSGVISPRTASRPPAMSPTICPPVPTNASRKDSTVFGPARHRKRVARASDPSSARRSGPAPVREGRRSSDADHR